MRTPETVAAVFARMQTLISAMRRYGTATHLTQLSYTLTQSITCLEAALYAPQCILTASQPHAMYLQYVQLPGWADPHSAHMHI